MNTNKGILFPDSSWNENKIAEINAQNLILGLREMAQRAEVYALCVGTPSLTLGITHYSEH